MNTMHAHGARMPAQAACKSSFRYLFPTYIHPLHLQRHGCLCCPRVRDHEQFTLRLDMTKVGQVGFSWCDMPSGLGGSGTGKQAGVPPLYLQVTWGYLGLPRGRSTLPLGVPGQLALLSAGSALPCFCRTSASSTQLRTGNGRRQTSRPTTPTPSLASQ